MSASVRIAGWIFKAVFLLALAGSAIISVVGAVVFWLYSRGLPELTGVEAYRPSIVTRVVTQDGVVVGEFFKERRYLSSYDQIPNRVISAFISAEDDRFFDHQGVNLASILRASIANFRAGQVVQGGSTITQQVAKSLLLTPERSFDRKIKEVILASRIERNFTKEQILFLYLNQIYLGHGSYGVQAASRAYFRKNVSDLTLAEAALLAGMPQAPGKYSPLLNPKRAKERQLYVLRRMLETGKITHDEHAQAGEETISIYDDENINLETAPYLVEYLRQYIVKKYGEKAAYEDGLTLTLPAKKESLIAARDALREGLKILDKRLGYRGPVKKIHDPKKIEEYLKEGWQKWLEKKYQFQAFLPGGELDRAGVLKKLGINREVDAVALGDKLEAVVIRMDDKKKITDLQTGALHLTLPMENMRWARVPANEKEPKAYRPEPTFPSQVLKRGDVVRVQVKEKKEDQIIVSLDQEPEVQGALVSLDVKTGYVLALEGGYDFSVSEFNRATQAMRQSGSAFKPIIFSAALEKGFTPASVIVDSPIVYNDAEFGKWKPSNFEERFYGDTTFRQALIKSRNVPTIKIVQELRVSPLIQYARRLGFTSQFSEDLSISLGSATVSPLELTRIYALFPRLGRRVNPIFHTTITDRSGVILEENQPDLMKWPVQIPPILSSPQAQAQAEIEAKKNKQETQETQESQDGETQDQVNETSPPAALVTGQSDISRKIVPLPSYPPPGDPDQVLDPRVAYVMTHLMKEVIAYGTGTQAKNLGKPAAAKTGTTNDYLDAWFLGFTPDVITGVWVGFDNQLSLGPGETGAKAALPIWLDYMRVATQGSGGEDFLVPPGIVYSHIHPATGKLVSVNATTSIREAFIEGTQPEEERGSFYRVRTGRDGVKGSSPPPAAMPADSSDFFKEDIE